MKKSKLIPPIGYGTWKLTGVEAPSILKNAIDCGYNLIDTAAAYGNETIIKRTLRDSSVRREEVLISGKLWNTKRQYDDVAIACKQSLKRLGIDYFDLYLVHWPASPALYDNWIDINSECWRAMEMLLTEGTVREIGVCNYLPHHLDELIKDASIIPAINQIELHPGYNNTETVQYCYNHEIVIQAWSPLGEGALLENPILKDIATRYDKSVAQICLRWCVQKGAIPITKAARIEHIHQNYDIFNFEISDGDMLRIDAIPFSGGAGYNPDTITIFG